ncbi:MAG: hypothetical protein JRN67_00625 [Nitrososphaerota archaeon]|nr:hypothetical protein [Nitrososphaerota archaeon]
MRQVVIRIPLPYVLGEDASYFFQEIEFAELVGLVGPSEHSFQVVVRIVLKDKKKLPTSLSGKSGILKVECSLTPQIANSSCFSNARSQETKFCTELGISCPGSLTVKMSG